MPSHTYYPIPEKNLEDADNNIEWLNANQNAKNRGSQRSLVVSLSIFLLLSLSMNAQTLYYRYLQPQKLYNSLQTQYAALSHNQEQHIMPDMDFISHNRSIANAAWESERMNTWRLFVALDDTYSASQNLPHSMRWPWDLDKGVYVLNAAHELHCVKVIRSFVVEKNDGVADEDLVWGYGHAIHCLNELRASVMCNADDTPLYTGWVNDNVGADEAVNGRGTKRMCRDWDALLDWADERSACYLSTHENREDKNFNELDRYKHCPHGARPWENP